MKTCLILAIRFIGGFAAAAAIIGLLLFGVSKIANAQSVPTHEAKPGEINRSFNYTMQVHGLEPTIAPTMAYDDISASYTTLRRTQCDSANKRNYALIQMIAREITAHPELGHMWAGALNTIHSLWCTSYD